MSRRRVAILISGSGTNMVRLLESMADPGHPGEAVLVLSNRADAAGLGKAESMGVPTAVIPHKGRTREAFDAGIQAKLDEVGAEFVCLAGFMRILTTDFVKHWQGRMINIHPSLLPLFKGLDTHARALESGMAVHGCTAHLVTPELDDGPILGQAAIAIRDGDTPESLAARLLTMEHKLYPLAFRRFLEGETRPVALFEDA